MVKFQAVQSSSAFQKGLSLPPCAKTTHFALHHFLSIPQPYEKSTLRKISTSSSADELGFVNNIVHNIDNKIRISPYQTLLGVVVPKRFARRAVTRTLFKRQIRAMFNAYLSNQLNAAISSDTLVTDLKSNGEVWIVRLRSSFDIKTFPSANSSALRTCLRSELKTLFDLAFQTLRKQP